MLGFTRFTARTWYLLFFVRSMFTMKRNITILTVCLALLAGLLLTMTAGAHPVAVTDSTRSDWFGNGPSASNIGTVARDSAGRGEFVWSDAKADQRVASPVGATGNITPEADLI